MNITNILEPKVKNVGRYRLFRFRSIYPLILIGLTLITIGYLCIYTDDSDETTTHYARVFSKNNGELILKLSGGEMMKYTPSPDVYNNVIEDKTGIFKLKYSEIYPQYKSKNSMNYALIILGVIILLISIFFYYKL